MSFKIELRDVVFLSGKNRVLDGVSLTTQPGGVTIFGGRSGSGKSVLLEICAGLLKPTEGLVFWDDEDITVMPKYELYDLRKSIGYVFQTNALISNHTVFDNIALPLKCGTDLSGEQINRRVSAIMEELGINRDIEKKFPEALYSAQLRMVALARALITDPQLLILDEPFMGVDPLTADIFLDAMHERWRRYDMSVVMAADSVNVKIEWNAAQMLLKNGLLELTPESFAAMMYETEHHH